MADAGLARGVPADAGMRRTALLFTLCFVLAQADKQVMGLVALPVQASLAIPDTALGFLQGGAFAVAFALGGLPLARLLDGGNRVRIAAACVALWSLATILCGLAWSFAALVLFRAATAAAEAGLPPAALSIFSQSRDRRLTARLTSMFMLAPFVGGGLVLLLGGLLLAAAAEPGVAVPGLDAWRLVFLAVGLPGLPLALLLWRLGREPPRPRGHGAGVPLPPYGKVLRTIFLERRYLRLYYLGLTAFYAFAAALIGWYPALLARGFGLGPPAAGALAGTFYLVAGVAGTLSAVAALSLRPRIRIGGLIAAVAGAAFVLLPVALLLPLAGSPGLSLACYALYAFVSAAVMAGMTLPIQLSLDSAIQARGLAIFSLLMSALAGSLGPLVVGVLLDVAQLSLAAALASLALCSGLLSVMLLSLAARAARRDLGEVD